MRMSADDTPTEASPTRLRLSVLPGRKPTGFRLEPDSAGRSALAGQLGLLGLKKLRFEGELVPHGTGDWMLTARLGATVTQACVATLAPVTTRIDETVERIYSASWVEPDGDEVEIPEDDRLEPLPETLDLAEVMSEALALALPLYPRAGAPGDGDKLFGPPGAAPLTDEAAKPFAGLKGLRDKLGNDEA